MKADKNKDKKAYLSQYLAVNTPIKRLCRLAELYPERKAEYENKISELNSLREEIEKKIEEIQKPVLRELLYQKYICGRSLLEASYEINYSKRQTERFHIEALEEFKL